MRSTVSPFYEYGGLYWRINGGNAGACSADILESLFSQVFAMLSHHNKVFVQRFDLHLPFFGDDNKQVSRFFDRLKPKVSQHYELSRVGYVWARELEKAKNQHYHCVILLDGNKIRHPFVLQQQIASCWQGLVDSGTCHRAGYHNLQRDDVNSLGDALYHISYLAKTRGKGYKATQAKNFGASRIKLRAK